MRYKVNVSTFEKRWKPLRICGIYCLHFSLGLLVFAQGKNYAMIRTAQIFTSSIHIETPRWVFCCIMHYMMLQMCTNNSHFQNSKDRAKQVQLENAASCPLCMQTWESSIYSKATIYCKEVYWISSDEGRDETLMSQFVKTDKGNVDKSRVFLQYEFEYAFSGFPLCCKCRSKMYKQMAFLQCECAHASSCVLGCQ